MFRLVFRYRNPSPTRGYKLCVKFQFVSLFCGNDTERVRAVTKRTAPSTHCLRRLAANYNLYIFSNSFGSYLYKYTNLRSPLDKYSFKYYYMYIFKYKLRRNTVLTLTVYCKSHKRRPIRFSTPMAFQDIQAQIPPAWCSVCGSEVFERGQDRCVRCRKARGANR